jgi:hypothetical protein
MADWYTALHSAGIEARDNDDSDAVADDVVVDPVVDPDVEVWSFPSKGLRGEGRAKESFGDVGSFFFSSLIKSPTCSISGDEGEDAGWWRPEEGDEKEEREEGTRKERGSRSFQDLWEMSSLWGRGRDDTTLLIEEKGSRRESIELYPDPKKKEA